MRAHEREGNRGGQEDGEVLGVKWGGGEKTKSEVSEIVWRVPLLFFHSESDVMTNRFWFHNCSEIEKEQLLKN